MRWIGTGSRRSMFLATRGACAMIFVDAAFFSHNEGNKILMEARNNEYGADVNLGEESVV